MLLLTSWLYHIYWLLLVCTITLTLEELHVCQNITTLCHRRCIFSYNCQIIAILTLFHRWNSDLGPTAICITRGCGWDCARLPVLLALLDSLTRLQLRLISYYGCALGSHCGHGGIPDRQRWRQRCRRLLLVVERSSLAGCTLISSLLLRFLVFVPQHKMTI